MPNNISCPSCIYYFPIPFFNFRYLYEGQYNQVLLFSLPQDIQVSVFFGFGWLLTFLERYSSMGFTLLLRSFLQWSMFSGGFYDHSDSYKIELEIERYVWIGVILWECWQSFGDLGLKAYELPSVEWILNF